MIELLSLALKENLDGGTVNEKVTVFGIVAALLFQLVPNAFAKGTTPAKNVSLSTAAASRADTISVNNLTNGMTQHGSKLVFDVIGRSASGEKLESSVTLDGTPINALWDDMFKTSYALNFGEDGAYRSGQCRCGHADLYGKL